MEDRFGINMKKFCRTHEAEVEKALEGAGASRALLEKHLEKLRWLQHERLIHLLVTLAFALMELVCAVTTMITGQLVAAALMLAFLVPLVPYVVHYYHLENGTQLLYGQYDRLRNRMQG